MGLVVPAVLPYSRRELDEKLALLAALPSVKRVQIDVVDGRFASPPSWPYSAQDATNGRPYSSPAELDAMVQRGEMLLGLDRVEYEIDLMCLDAEAAAEAWLALGATRLTFHAESAMDVPRFLQRARDRYGDFVAFGLALNVASDLALLERNLAGIAYVQFMGIAKIGRQGQPFDPRVFEKIRVFHSRHPETPIQVDGGVSLGNARKLLVLGAADLVVGSAVALAQDPAAVLASFNSLSSPFGV